MSSYIPGLYDFLRRVRDNNNRPWFHEHKAEYDELRSLWMDDLERLISLMSQWEPALSAVTARSAAYRFYRDTRFSLDKSPYKLFFSAGISTYGKKMPNHAGYYLQMGINDSPGGAPESGLYGGLWMPDGPTLNKLRHAIVDNVEEWDEVTSGAEIDRWFPGWCDEGSLKTVPKGWCRNHPQAPLLRLKQYGKFCPCDEAFFSRPDWVEEASERMRLLKPMVDFLNYSVDEDTSF